MAGEKGKTFGNEAGSAARRGSRSLGDVIVFLIKLFGYFILGTICFFLVVLLFVGGFLAIGYFPLKDFVLTGGTQNLLAWGTLIFFILVPMIGVITWIIRRIAKIRKGSKMLRLGFIACWIVGWICISFLFASVSKDFRESSQVLEQEVYLSNPGVKSLEITTIAPGQRFTRNSWTDFQPFDNDDQDTAYVRNIEVHIARSTNDSFRVTMTKMASGYKPNYADTLASMINFNAAQKDSQLVIDRSIAVNKTDKFRNQYVILTIYVPVGKQIYINRNVGWPSRVRFEGPWSREWEDIRFENIEHGWDEGEWYTMTKDGLYDSQNRPADRYKREQMRIDEDGINMRSGNQRVKIDSNGIMIETYDEDNGTYRYEKAQPKNRIDSMEINVIKERQRYNDSLKKEKDKIDRLLNNGDKKEDGTAMITALPTHDPMIFLN